MKHAKNKLTHRAQVSQPDQILHTEEPTITQIKQWIYRFHGGFELFQTHSKNANMKCEIDAVAGRPLPLYSSVLLAFSFLLSAFRFIYILSSSNAMALLYVLLALEYFIYCSSYVVQTQRFDISWQRAILWSVWLFAISNWNQAIFA